MRLFIEKEIGHILPIRGMPGNFCFKLFEKLKPQPDPFFLDKVTKYCNMLGIENPRSWKLKGYSGENEEIKKFLKDIYEYGILRRDWPFARHQIGVKFSRSQTKPQHICCVQRSYSKEEIHNIIIETLNKNRHSYITFNDTDQQNLDLFLGILNGTIPPTEYPIHLLKDPDIDELISEILKGEF